MADDIINKENANLQKARLPETPMSEQASDLTQLRHPGRWRNWLPKSGTIIGVLILGVILGWVTSRSTHPITIEPPSTSTNTKQESRESPQWWTCAMHPQIRQRSPGKCPICFMDLVPASGNEEGSLGPRQITMTREAIALADIATAPVQRFFPTREIRLWGRIEFDETRLATISARFPGRLERLFVDYTGVPVRFGDHLVDIYSPDLVVAQQELLQAMASLATAPKGTPQYAMANSLLRSSEEKLRLWGILPKQIEEIKQRGTATEHVTLYAPLGGIVITKHAKEGDYVKTGDPIYTIADLSEVWVFFDGYEQDLPWLRYGQTVSFETDAYPGEEFTGRIAFIQPTVQESTRTIRVRVNVPNPNQRLKPGMLARGIVEAHLAAGDTVFEPALAGKWICPMHPEVVADTPQTCSRCGMELVKVESVGYAANNQDLSPPLVIPATAPLITGKRALVYILVPNTEEPVFESREIVLGPRVREGYIVHAGLNEGELVVVRGNFKLDSAVQLADKPSMMYTPAGNPVSETQVATQVKAEVEIVDLEERITFAHSWREFWQDYLAAQRALAEDNPAAAARALGELKTTLEKGPPADLPSSLHQTWDKHAQGMVQVFGSVQPDQNIDQLRQVFDHLSQQAIKLAVGYGYPGKGRLAVAHCPMAFEGRGADWLQEGETIANPYFGSAMLRCGEIKTWIASVDAPTPDDSESSGRAPEKVPTLKHQH